jgi:cobalamin biosynthesis Co2+ chelatase CbiK
MITGFEKETHELTEYEKNILLPVILKGLSKKKGKRNAVTSSYICRVLKTKGFKISRPRFRKIVQYIRINGLIDCLISTRNGYYIAESYQECFEYIQSFDQRINSMTVARDALQYQMKYIINLNPLQWQQKQKPHKKNEL